MPRMGATSFESELSRVLGSRNDVSSRLTRWRRDGYWWIGRIPDLKEFVSTYDRSVNPGTTSFTLPADLRALYSIRVLRPARREISLVPRSYLDRQTTTAGTIQFMARQDRTIYFTSLSAGTQFRFTYQRQPTLPTGTGTHVYAEEWEPVHLARSAYVAFVELFGEERAQARKQLLDEAVNNIGWDPRKIEKVCAVESIETRNYRITARLYTQLPWG